jgi:hypothetical protein
MIRGVAAAFLEDRIRLCILLGKRVDRDAVVLQKLLNSHETSVVGGRSLIYLSGLERAASLPVAVENGQRTDNCPQSCTIIVARDAAREWTKRLRMKRYLERPYN